MTFVHLLPALASLLALCAHVFRGGGLLFVLPILSLLPLLLVPAGWVARLFQFVLAMETLEWVRTAVVLALERDPRGEPWLRMVVILGAVALFTLLSAVAFESQTLRRAYPRRPLL